MPLYEKHKWLGAEEPDLGSPENLEEAGGYGWDRRDRDEEGNLLEDEERWQNRLPPGLHEILSLAAYSASSGHIPFIGKIPFVSKAVALAPYSLRRRHRRKAASEQVDHYVKGAQSQIIHKHAERWLLKQGVSQEEIDRLNEESRQHNLNQISRQPRRVAASGYPRSNIEEWAEGEPEMEPYQPPTIAKGGMRERRPTPGYKPRVNDRITDDPFIKRITPFIRDLEERLKNKVYPLGQRDELRSQLRRYRRSYDKIAETNQEKNYSMEDPAVRPWVEYRESVEIAKKLDLNFAEIIGHEGNILREGLIHIFSAALGHGDHTAFADMAEDEVATAEFMGELMGPIGLSSFGVAAVTTPIETLKYKPNIPMLLMFPYLLKYIYPAFGRIPPAMAEKFRKYEAASPVFASEMAKLKGKVGKIQELALKIPFAKKVAFFEMKERYKKEKLKGVDEVRAVRKLSKEFNDLIDEPAPGSVVTYPRTRLAADLLKTLTVGYLMGFPEIVGIPMVKGLVATFRGAYPEKMIALERELSMLEGAESTAAHEAIKEAQEVMPRIDEEAAFQSAAVLKEGQKEEGLVPTPEVEFLQKPIDLDTTETVSRGTEGKLEGLVDLPAEVEAAIPQREVAVEPTPPPRAAPEPVPEVVAEPVYTPGETVTVYTSDGKPVKVTVSAVSEEGGILIKGKDGREALLDSVASKHDPLNPHYTLESLGYDALGPVKDIPVEQLNTTLARIEEVLEHHQEGGSLSQGPMRGFKTDITAIKAELQRRAAEKPTEVVAEPAPRAATFKEDPLEYARGMRNEKGEGIPNVEAYVALEQKVRSQTKNENTLTKDPVTGEEFTGTGLMDQLEKEGKPRMEQEFQERRGYTKEQIADHEKLIGLTQGLMKKGFDVGELQYLANLKPKKAVAEVGVEAVYEHWVPENIVTPDGYLLNVDGKYKWTQEAIGPAWTHANARLERLMDPNVYPQFKKVVLMVGIPGSGKSTWLKANNKPDTIYFDATLTTKRGRSNIIKRVKEAGLDVEAVWLNTPTRVAKARNLKRPENREVPAVAFDRMVEQIEKEPPTQAEGFTAPIREIKPEVAEPKPEPAVGIKKVISGGQVGADRLGLEAARELGLETGGVAPKGFRTKEGPDPSLKDFGLTESTSTGYKKRTEQNVIDADATVVFADNVNSPGTKLTRKYAAAHNKPYIENPTPEQFAKFARDNNVETLNVAGNRTYKDSAKVKAVLSAATKERSLSPTVAAEPPQPAPLIGGGVEAGYTVEVGGKRIEIVSELEAAKQAEQAYREVANETIHELYPDGMGKGDIGFELLAQLNDRAATKEAVRELFSRSPDREFLFEELGKAEERAQDRAVVGKRFEVAEALQKGLGRALSPKLIKDITELGAIVEGSPLHKLLTGETQQGRGRGAQARGTIPKDKIKDPEKPLGTPYVVKMGEHPESAKAGQQEMIGVDAAYKPVKSGAGDAFTERRLLERMTAEEKLLYADSKGIPATAPKKTIDKRNRRIKKDTEALAKLSMADLREIAKSVGIKPGKESKADLAARVAQDPRAAHRVGEAARYEASLDRATEGQTHIYQSTVGKILASHLPLKIKARLLKKALEHPALRRVPQSFGSHRKDYPFASLREEIEGGIRGEITHDVIMLKSSKPVSVTSKENIDGWYKQLMDEVADPENPMTMSKALEIVQKSTAELLQDIKDWKKTGKTEGGETRRGGKPGIKRSVFGSGIFRRSDRVSQWWRNKEGHRGKDYGRSPSLSSSKIIGDSPLRELSKEQLKSVSDYMQSKLDDAFNLALNDPKTKAGKVNNVVIEYANGNKKQESLSPAARKFLDEIGPAHEVISAKEAEAFKAKMPDLPPNEARSISRYLNWKASQRDVTTTREALIEEGATTRPTKEEIKRAEETPEANGGILEVELTKDGAKKVPVKEEKIEVVEGVTEKPKLPEEKIEIIDVTEEPPPGKGLKRPRKRTETIGGVWTQYLRNQTEKFLDFLESRSIGLSRRETDTYLGGLIDIIGAKEHGGRTLLASDIMKGKVRDALVERLKEKGFEGKALENLVSSIDVWLKEFDNPFFASEGAAKFYETQTQNAFAKELTALNRVPGIIKIRTGKKSSIEIYGLLETVRKVVEETVKDKELFDHIFLEAHSRIMSNIISRAKDRALGRVIMNQLDRRGVSATMTPGQAMARLAASYLISKEARSYGLPNRLTRAGSEEVSKISRDELLNEAALEPRAFVRVAEEIINRELTDAESVKYVGLTRKQIAKEDHVISADSVVGKFLSESANYKKLSGKTQYKDKDLTISLLENLKEEDREVLGAEGVSLIKGDKVHELENSFLNDMYIHPDWHERMAYNQWFKAESDRVADTAFGRLFLLSKEGLTVNRMKTNLGNTGSHIISVGLATGEGPIQVTSRFARTGALVFLYDRNPRAFNKRFPKLREAMEQADAARLIKTTSAMQEFQQLKEMKGAFFGRFKRYRLMRKRAYALEDSIPKTAEFIRNYTIAKDILGDIGIGETFEIRTTPHSYTRLRKSKTGFERRAKGEKWKPLRKEDFQKILRNAVKLETDILIPDYSRIPRLLKELRSGLNWYGKLGMFSPFLSFPYLVMDMPGKPGWASRALFGDVLYPMVRSENQKVQARWLARSLATQTRRAVKYGMISQLYDDPSKRYLRDSVRHGLETGPTQPTYMTQGPGNRIKAFRLSNWNAAFQTQLVWGTAAQTLVWMGDKVRGLFDEPLTNKDYDDLSETDKIKYKMLKDVEENKTLTTKQFLALGFMTGTPLMEAMDIATTGREYGVEVENPMGRAIAKLLPAIIPGGDDFANVIKTGYAVFDPKGSLSSMRNLVKLEERKRKLDYAFWTPEERLSFFLDNVAAAVTQIYMREVPIVDVVAQGKDPTTWVKKDPHWYQYFLAGLKKGTVDFFQKKHDSSNDPRKKRLFLRQKEFFELQMDRHKHMHRIFLLDTLEASRRRKPKDALVLNKRRRNLERKRDLLQKLAREQAAKIEGE